MKKMLQKIFSILLAACFVLSVVPAPAAAAGNDVTNGEYAEGVWSEGGNGSKSYKVDGADVTLSKTATAIGENEFRIDLQVKTSTTTSTFTAANAVVLVMDVSGSMKYCADCGNEYSHEDDCTYHKSGWYADNSVKSYQSRRQAAKDAAASFLDAYAGTDASASRMLAIVSFQSSATTILDWVNVAGGEGKDGYDQAYNTIYSLGANGGTNLDDGLSHALTLLNKDTVKNAASKNVIALTDGAPTKSQHYGNGTSGSADINRETATQAANVRGTGATLHTVCFGVANESTYWGGITVGEFLRESVATSGKAHNADNTAELNQAFAAITESITSGLSGSGLTVTDPMAPMISVTSGTGEHFSSDGGNTFTWKLTTDDVTENGNVTTYVYNYSYTVKLDVQDPDFKEGDFYPTNERTYLNVDDDTKLEFPVPGVKGVLPRTSVTVTKAWSDADNQDGLRPESVTVQLKMNGENKGEPVTLGNGNWSHTWTDLIAQSGGVTHEYTVEEVNVPAGYTESVTGSAANGYTITNTHAPEKTSVKVTKNWDDNENQDGKRPTSIQVQLYADGVEEGEPVTLNADNEWTYTWNVPVNKAGAVKQAVTYTVDEVKVPAEYEKDITGSAANGYLITNTHAPEQTSVKVTKKWDDNNNQDGIRPESVNIVLMNGEDQVASATLNKENNWTTTFDNLDKYAGGKEIAYTVKESGVPTGYTSTTTGTKETGFTITNSHTPATTEVKVTKIWDDKDDAAGFRPDKITVELYANEKATGKTLGLSGEGNTWTGIFENLPLNESGKPIKYTVVELDVPEKYSSVANGLTITNSYTPETTSVTITKIWNDASNQDGIRPKSVQFTLYANGEPTDKIVSFGGEGDTWTTTVENLPKYANAKEIEYTVKEVEVDNYNTTYSDDTLTITNTHTPATTDITVTKIWNDESDLEGFRPDEITVQLLADGEPCGNPVTFSGEDNVWNYTFTGLAKNKNGNAIEYTVEELSKIDGYTTTYSEDKLSITNTHVVERIDITIVKNWEDGDNRDGKRPDVVLGNLLKNGEPYDEWGFILSEASNWTWVYRSIPKYADGKLIDYSVEEWNVPEKYEVDIAEDGYTFTITNTYTPETTSITVNKVWNDNDDQDGMREKVTVRLYSNGQPTEYTLTLTDKENSSGTFEDLFVYENKEPVVYTVVEENVPEGYTAEIVESENGFTITNTHEVKKTEISVEKVWDDADDQDGIRPDSITIKLLANKKVVDEVVLSEENEWTHTFTGLDVNAERKAIEYSIEEVKVEGYKAMIQETDNGFMITNSHTPETIKEIKVTKVWDDADDQDGIRPEKITVNLLANGKIVDSKELKATLRTIFTGDWTATFTDLDKYENGEEIEYTITENAVSGYETDITGSVEEGFTVTNTHEPEMTKLDVQKFWKDDNNKEKTRADSVKITLYANGKSTGKTVTLNEKNQWFDSFENLPKYDNGKEIKYTVKEASLALYKASYSYNGTKAVVTNTLSEVPNTGDTSNVGLYLGLMGVCAVAAVALILLNKKKRNA